MSDDPLHEKCARCGVIGQDRRTLFMACLYEMREFGVPFEIRGIEGRMVKHVRDDPTFGSPRFAEPEENAESYKHAFYTLLVCKGCRGDWLMAIQAWFRSEPSPGARHSNDSRDDELDSLAKLTSDAERLRADLVGLAQRADDILGPLRSALDAAEQKRRPT